MKSDFCKAKYLTALEGRESSFLPNLKDSRGSTESVPLFLFGVGYLSHSSVTPSKQAVSFVTLT